MTEKCGNANHVPLPHFFKYLFHLWITFFDQRKIKHLRKNVTYYMLCEPCNLQRWTATTHKVHIGPQENIGVVIFN